MGTVSPFFSRNSIVKFIRDNNHWKLGEYANTMRKRKTVLLARSDEVRENLPKFLDAYECQTVTWDKFKGINKLKDEEPRLIVLESENGGAKYEVEIAKEIAADTQLRDIPRVLLTDLPEEKRKVLYHEVRHSDPPLFEDVIPRELSELIDPLGEIVRNKVYEPLRVAFVSAGGVMQGATKTLLKNKYYSQFIAEVGCVSINKTEGHTEEALRTALEIKDDPRFRMYDNLEDLVAQNHDLGTITSSAAQGKWSSNPGRNSLWKAEKKGRVILPIVSGIAAMLKKSGEQIHTLWNMCVNPIGTHMTLAVKAGIPAPYVTGLSVLDTLRPKDYLRHLYYETFEEYLDEDKIYVRVLGQHGEEMPLEKSIRINDMTLEEVGELALEQGKEFGYDREEMIQYVRNQGGKEMSAKATTTKADRLDLMYTNLTVGLARLCEYAARRWQPEESLYAVREETPGKYFSSNGPAEFDYSGQGLRVRPMPFSDEVLPEERAQLGKEAEVESTFQWRETTDLLEREGLAD